MDIGNGLITKIVDEGQLNEAIRSGITTEFLDEDSAPVYNYLQRHFSEYKSVPTRDAVARAFPNFEFSDYKEPLEYFIDTLKESYRRNVLEDKIDEVANVYLSNTKEAEAILRSALADLHITEKSARDVSITESALSRIEAYEHRKANPGVDGIRSGWEKLDYQTLGWHPEEFIVLVGEKYMGKSWKIIWLAYQAYLQGENVALFTREMSQDAIIRRFDSIYAQVTFDSLRRGELTDVEEKRYREKMAELAESKRGKLIVAREGVQTVQDMQTKAVETEATIIFSDSVYLFNADNERYPNEVARRQAVSGTCKRIATQLQIPFIVSVQAGRRKSKNAVPSLDDIEWSNAFSQDADTVFYTQRDELDRELHRSQLWLLKSRDGDLTNFYVNEDFNYMQFTQSDDSAEPSAVVFDEEEEHMFNE